MRFQNKTVLITGGGTGIGRAIARAFAREGALVAIAGRRQGPLDQTLALIGGEAIGIQADVSNKGAVDAMVANVVEKGGRLDVLVNNASTILSRTPIGDTEEEDWDRVMDINVKGVYLCSKAAVNVMKGQREGVIINIASVAGQRGQLSNAAYGTTKGAVMNLTRTLAVDYGPYGIRVNSLSPALVDTEMARTRLKPGEDWDERARKEWIPNYPLGRLGTPEDIANGALFLASSDASWVTGIDLRMDGGLLARL